MGYPAGGTSACRGHEEVYLETLLGEGTSRSNNIQMNDNMAGCLAAGSSVLLTSAVGDVMDQRATLI